MTRRTFIASLVPSAVAAGVGVGVGVGLSGCAGGKDGASRSRCAPTPEAPPILRIALVNPSAPAVPNRVLYPLTHETKGDFDLAAMSLLTGFASRWPRMFWRSGPSNRLLDAGYTAADDALDALRRARSPEDEQPAAREVLDIMRRDPPAVFIGPQAMLRAVHRRWQVPSESNSLTDSLAKWKLAPAAGCDAGDVR